MPDNYVQDPYNTQNFNRYSYVLNNPLKYTDPSGEFFVASLLGAAIGVVTNGIGNLFRGQAFFKGAGKAALFGAIGGAAAFGIGEVASGIATSIGSGASTAFQMGAHSILGGTLSVAQGGSFGSGALAGGLSSGISSATGGLLKGATKFWKAMGIVGSGSVSGGLGSAIAGGNFWDGFRQGAISSGLNHLAHSLQERIELNTLLKKSGYDPKAWAYPTDYTASKLAGDIFPEMYNEAGKLDFEVVKQATIEGEYGHTFGNYSDKILTGVNIKLSTSAFRSYRQLASTIGHELVHAIDHVNGNYLKWSNQNGVKYARNLMEYRAYSWQLSIKAPLSQSEYNKYKNWYSDNH